MKSNIIPTEENEYLKVLSAVDENIRSVYFIGKLPKGRIPTVAVVGSRKPTAYGLEIAGRLAYDAAKKGAVVVSGLAYGIDAVAHTAALEAGGRTIAVLAHGLDTIYPPRHRQLAERIVGNGGALISEYPEGIPPYKAHFLARNRIVSGLCDVLVVVEAAARSGTLSTAAHALNQGKTVCAIPGNVTSPISAGCNSLIRQGATLVRDSDDVLDELGLAAELRQTSFSLADNVEEDAIVKALKNGVRDGDELLRHSGLDAPVFSQTLSMLEIKGTVKNLGANNWSLK